MKTGIYIDFNQRFSAAFGYMAKGGLITANRAILSASMQTFERGDAQFANVEFKNKKSGVSVLFGLSVFGELFEGAFAAPPMVSFEIDKNIKTTLVDSSDIEVIECFGSNAWQINLDCIVVDVENHWFDSNALLTIKNLFNVNDTYEVIGDIFQALDITEVYFTALQNLEIVDGYNDTIKFKLKAKSIKPSEFFISSSGNRL